MKNGKVLIAIDKKSFRDVLSEVFNSGNDAKITPDWETDMLTKTKSAKLLKVSLPTLDRYVASGWIKQYGIGHRKYFSRAELIESLKKS